jgi:FlaA1/EpsC-like NDP-sugar epimerase
MVFMTLSLALTRMLALPRRQKRAIQLVMDIVLLSLALCVALMLRLGGLSPVHWPEVWLVLATVLPPSLGLFIHLGFYRAILRYADSAVLQTLLIGALGSGVLMLGATQLLAWSIPGSVAVTYSLLAFVLTGGVRLAMRSLCLLSQAQPRAPVIIYGAGSSGRQLLGSLRRGPSFAPVAFVDDAVELQGAEIGGVRVFARKDLANLIAKTGAKTLLLAMPRLDRAARRAVLQDLSALPVRLQTVPALFDLISGKAEVADLREVAIEDLLGRDPVPPMPDLISQSITGKVVMVTGAGGSIGSELCRQILLARPATLILFEMSEASLYQSHAELVAATQMQPVPVPIVPVIGSVCDAQRVRSVLAAWGVQTLYHAAAYKHVPLVEQNVIEGIGNNLFGTATLSEAAVLEGVEAFILISTDKAVRPTNIMGASKRMAEMVCQAWAAQQSKTRFSMVRFGNVLGSSGSVIPLFRRQIAEGGPITVTDPEITRYFMTIPEAAQLVLQAGALAKGGEVFVLDMGKPVKILDLAQRLARLSGLKPVVVPMDAPQDIPIDGDIAIVFSGLRPGEKLHEELLICHRATATQHPQIFMAHEVFTPWDNLKPMLDALAEACASNDVPRLKQLLTLACIGYSATPEVSDFVWLQGSQAEASTRFAAE